MRIQVNGQPVETAVSTIGALLLELQIVPIGIAVAVNESVVRRAKHPDFLLHEGDKIEIIRAVQGG